MGRSRDKVMMAIIDRRTGLPVKLLGEVKNPEVLFTLPPPDTVLWRYSDYRWIHSVITDNKLYFRRADRFKDRLEGRFTEGNRQRPSAMFAEVARSLPTETAIPPSRLR